MNIYIYIYIYILCIYILYIYIMYIYIIYIYIHKRIKAYFKVRNFNERKFCKLISFQKDYTFTQGNSN